MVKVPRLLLLPLKRIELEEAALLSEVISAERGKDILLRVIEELAGKSICTDSTDIHTIKMMTEKLGERNVKVNNKPFTMSRIIKDIDEQENISKSARIIDRLFKLSTEQIRENRTEIELLALLVSETYLLGGTLVSYKVLDTRLLLPVVLTLPFLIPRSLHDHFQERIR